MIVCTKSVILIYEVIERANAWIVRVRQPGICSRSGRQWGTKRGTLGSRELPRSSLCLPGKADHLGGDRTDRGILCSAPCSALRYAS